jgi:hypothetical protein
MVMYPIGIRQKCPSTVPPVRKSDPLPAPVTGWADKVHVLILWPCVCTGSKARFSDTCRSYFAVAMSMSYQTHLTANSAKYGQSQIEAVSEQQQNNRQPCVWCLFTLRRLSRYGPSGKVADRSPCHLQT